MAVSIHWSFETKYAEISMRRTSHYIISKLSNMNVCTEAASECSSAQSDDDQAGHSCHNGKVQRESMRWRGLETLFQANRHFRMEPKTKEYAELDALEARFGRSRAPSAASLDSEKRDTRIE
jgi:hypothetical protein